jgi:hypothetical protein
MTDIGYELWDNFYEWCCIFYPDAWEESVIPLVAIFLSLSLVLFVTLRCCVEKLFPRVIKRLPTF